MQHLTFLPSADMLLRILLSGLLGGTIGLERVWHGRPGGFRTSMLIAMSSCVFTILSVEGFGSGPAQDASSWASASSARAR